MKKNIIKFIIQSLVIFSIWLVGEVLIWILDFEKPSVASAVWTAIAIIGCAVFRMIKSEKKNND